MLTKLKKQIQDKLAAEAKMAHKLGFTPNRITVVGFVLAIASAVSYAVTSLESPVFLLAAAFFMLASGFCDTMDGIVARTYKQATAFGGFFDSVLDRGADALSFVGIIISGLCTPAFGYLWASIITILALVASMLVSYTRARAEVLGLKMESVGFAERAERMLILVTVSIVGFFWLPIIGYGVALIAVLSIITVIQRVFYVYRGLKKEKQ